MIDSKIIHVIKIFSAIELKKLGRFLVFTSENEQMLKFYRHIIHYYPFFESDEIKKEFVFKKLFPKQKYDDIKMRHLISGLNKIIYSYFEFEEIQQDKLIANHLLLNGFRKRNLSFQFESLLKDQLQNEKIISSNDPKLFLYEYLNQDTYRHYLYNQLNRSVEPNLQVLSDSLDLHYIINKLKIYCEAISYQNISKVNYDIKFIDTILPHIEKSGISQNLLIRFYSKILQLLTEKEINNNLYQELKELLLEQYKKLPANELDDVYSLTKNFCIRQVNKANALYVKELFYLYKFEIKRFREEKQKIFSPNTYKNITSIGLRLHEYEWVHNFLQEFVNYLPEDHKNNSYHINLAQYYFSTRQYKNVNKQLFKIGTGDLFVTLSAKALQVRTYYELHEIMPLESLLQSFKMFISSKKKIGYHRDNYLNFIKFVSRLNRFNYKDHERKHIQKLREEIQSEKNILEKDWLLEKISELEEKR